MQHQPYPYVLPNYGVKIQYAPSEDTMQILNNQQAKFIQKVTGAFLFFLRVVNRTMLTALRALATEQAKPTMTTIKNTQQFLNYAMLNSEAKLKYKASNIVLLVHSDVSYLNKQKACSRVGGQFFLTTTDFFPPNNGTAHNTVPVVKAVMTSAAEAELGTLFINAKQAATMQHTLIKMGHSQLLTPIQTDNSIAFGIVTCKIIPKAMKAMGMQFYWLHGHK